MALDNFRRVLFTAGEQVVSADMNALQRQLHMLVLEMFCYPRMGNVGGDPSDAIGTQYDPEGAFGALGQDSSTIPTDVALCPFPSTAVVMPAGSRQLTVGVPGPIVQILESVQSEPTEASQWLMPYWIKPGEFTLTTDIGDANPRVDLVEMRLQYTDTSSESRVSSIDAVKASRDLNPLTTNCETVIRARVAGKGGNNISIAFVADGAGVGSLTANGNALIFHYQSGVTTVANFETAVAASDLVEVQTTDGAGTLTAPGDTFAATFLTGGVDRLILSSSLNKSRRVQATFQIKKGTAAAVPVYPTPTAGFCALAAVYIPALHNAIHSLSNMRDVRLPLGGLEIHDVMFHQMNESGGGTSWIVEKGNGRIISGAAAGFAYAYCPVGGHSSRLIAIGVFGRKQSGNNAVKLKKLTYTDGVNSPTLDNVADLENTIGDGMSSVPLSNWQIADANDFADGRLITDGTRPAGSRLGTPFWTNGEPYGPMEIANQQVFDSTTTIKKIAVEFEALGSGDQVSFVRFYTAKGMR